MNGDGGDGTDDFDKGVVGESRGRLEGGGWNHNAEKNLIESGIGRSVGMQAACACPSYTRRRRTSLYRKRSGTEEVVEQYPWSRPYMVVEVIRDCVRRKIPREPNEDIGATYPTKQYVRCAVNHITKSPANPPPFVYACTIFFVVPCTSVTYGVCISISLTSYFSGRNISSHYPLRL